MAETVDAAFSDLLAHAYPPNANELCGLVSRSERLARLLGQTLDRAALELQRRLDNADGQPERAASAQTDADRARAELAALGIQTT